MRNRTGLVVSIFILFVIPIIGYFVLRQGAKDRMEVSGRLKPKDSLQVDFEVIQNIDDVEETVRFIDLDYILKILVKNSSELETEKIKDLLFIINDRKDLGFIIYGDEPKVYQGDRIHYVKLSNYEEKILSMGDIILLDDKNRMVMSYKYGEDRLYGRLLEDISYLLPMLDYQREKKSEEDGN